MEKAVSPLQLANLTLQGAVMAICLELAVRCLFSPTTQKSWVIRSLKTVMAICMMIKAGIFSAFMSSSLSERCKLAGRIADSMFHISTIAGMIILLLRVKVIAPIQHQRSIIIFHAIIVLIRFGVAIPDVVLSDIWTDPNSGICQYEEKHELGGIYTLYDCAVDLYVSFMITFILCMHIRRLRRVHLAGSNFNLYISVALTNVIRTAILTILNIVCTIYYLSESDNLITIRVLWPLGNGLFVILIGYDTNIAKSIRKLRSQVFNDIDKNRLEPPSRDSHQRQQGHSSISLPDIEQQFNRATNEPLSPISTLSNRDTSRLRRQSTISALESNEDQGVAIRLSGSSTISQTGNQPTTTRQNNC